MNPSHPARSIGWTAAPVSQKVLQKSIVTEHKDIWQIEFAQKERLLLVIAAPGSKGFHAYHESDGTLKWSVMEKFPEVGKKIWPCGMTTDKEGRLFVRDSHKGNNCIHMFRVVDGSYLGCLIREGERGLGDLGRIFWSITANSLLVSHGRGDDESITTLKVN